MSKKNRNRICKNESETKNTFTYRIRFFVIRFWVIRSRFVVDWGMIRSRFWGMVWSWGRNMDRDRGVVGSGSRGRGMVGSGSRSMVWSWGWGMVWFWSVIRSRCWGMVRCRCCSVIWRWLVWQGWGMDNGRSMVGLMYGMGYGWSMTMLNGGMA